MRHRDIAISESDLFDARDCDRIPEEEATHYLPVFTQQRARTQRAVCGVYVAPKEHSSEPTCPDCRAYLERQEAEDADTAAALEAEYPEFRGKLVTK